MRAVNFASNRRRRPTAIEWKNFQGENEVDNNSVLPVQQVPFAYNTDFGRQIGAAAKRYGLENIVTASVDSSITGTTTVGLAEVFGQVFTPGSGVTNISRIMTKSLTLLDLDNAIMTLYSDATKATKLGETTNIINGDFTFITAIFTPAVTVSPGTSYFFELSGIAVTQFYAVVNEDSGAAYVNGVLDDMHDLYYATYYDSIGIGGVLSQHCFHSTAGDIPLIAHGTDVYKLSGASSTRTTDTEAEFNAGTLTEVVVLPDISTPTAPTIAATGAGSWTGDYYTKVSFVDVSGAESDLSVASNKLTFSGSTGGVSWSNIPTGEATITQRKLWRTKAGGSIYYLVATIDDNTTTTYAETVADGSLTVIYEDRRIVLARTGDTKNATPIRAQTTINYTYQYNAGQLVAQDYKVPTGVYKIYSISPYVTEMAAGDSLTLTLYTNSAKTTEVASATLTGAHTDGYQEFVLDTLVTPGATYYIEIVIGTGTAVKIGSGAGVSVNGEYMYLNGTPYSASVAMTFYVYQAQYELTGTYESEVIDLTTAPTIATLTFSETLNGQTVAWFAKCSNDNVVWGDYQAVQLSGDGIPLGRYVKIKAILSSLTGAATPSITNYTLTYNTGYGTAMSIKDSLSGSKVRFVDWDDRVWFTDGGKNYVYDGGFVVAPDAPTVSASGSGTITGAYNCKIAYVNADGTEGAPSVAVAVTASSSLQFDWSDIPVLSGYTRKLYRTKAGGTIYYLVATLNASDTTYTDTVADASLTTAIETHTGHNVLEVGTSPAAGCTKPPAASIIHVHKNYAFYVTAATPSVVYISKVADPHSIPNLEFFLFPSAVLSLETYGDYLIASGADFTWYTGGTIFDPDPAGLGDWSWKVVSGTIGCISHEGMIECLDSADNEIVVFPLATGIKYLNANLMGTDLHSVPLSRNIQHYFDEAIDREKMSAIFYDQAYYIAINWSNPATTADNHNNAVFKLDLRNREWSGLWELDVTGFFIANGDLYMTSSTCGRVYKHSGSDDDGEAIDMIVDSSYVGDHDNRAYTKLIAFIKRGCVTDDTTILTRVDNLERTITLGSSTSWAGSGGSARDVQDEIISPQKSISGGRGYKMGWRFRDNSTNDMVLYGITVLAEPPN